MADPFYTAGSFTAKQSLGYLIRRAYKLMLPRAEAIFADSDFTLSQWIALKLVGDGLAGTGAEVARQLSHNSGATTRLIDQLEERGLIRRERQKDDRRFVTLELTGRGKDAIASMSPRMKDLWNEFLVDFEREEVSTLIDLLSRLVDSIEKRSAP